jgi:predicted RNase H-like HicB family nuclease
VIYERDERGWWVASVRGVRGCHTQGRTLEQARRRVREALGLFVKDADTADFVTHIRLPKSARRALTRGLTARQRADQERAKAAKALQEAMRALARTGLSRRDTGELLGLSHQRVQQIVGAQRG